MTISSKGANRVVWHIKKWLDLRWPSQTSNGQNMINDGNFVLHCTSQITLEYCVQWLTLHWYGQTKIPSDSSYLWVVRKSFTVAVKECLRNLWKFSRKKKLLKYVNILYMDKRKPCIWIKEHCVAPGSRTRTSE